MDVESVLAAQRVGEWDPTRASPLLGPNQELTTALSDQVPSAKALVRHEERVFWIHIPVLSST